MVEPTIRHADYPLVDICRDCLPEGDPLGGGGLHQGALDGSGAEGAGVMAGFVGAQAVQALRAGGAAHGVRRRSQLGDSEWTFDLV